jgi:hypothetical protein
MIFKFISFPIDRKEFNEICTCGQDLHEAETDGGQRRAELVAEADLWPMLQNFYGRNLQMFVIS